MYLFRRQLLYFIILVLEFVHMKGAASQEPQNAQSMSNMFFQAIICYCKPIHLTCCGWNIYFDNHLDKFQREPSEEQILCFFKHAHIGPFASRLFRWLDQNMCTFVILCMS